MTQKHRGSCLCGGVRFTFEGALDDTYFCHCTQCRKNYGMHGAFAGVRRESLAIRASNALVAYASSPSTVRTFCGRCGSPIAWDREGYEMIYVCLGLLDGDIAVAAPKNIHTEDKGAYYTIRD